MLTTGQRTVLLRDAEAAAKQVERRLVWVVDLAHHRPLEPAIQPRTKTGWGKVRPLRELAQALTVALTDTDRLLLGLLVEDQEGVTVGKVLRCRCAGTAKEGGKCLEHDLVPFYEHCSQLDPPTSLNGVQVLS